MSMCHVSLGSFCWSRPLCCSRDVSRTSPVRRLRIATGSDTGVYYQLGGKLAGQWHAKLGLDASAYTTKGSIGNLKELHEHKADVALVAADAAAKDNKGLRALARVYDDYIQVIARADSGISTLADTRGQTGVDRRTGLRGHRGRHEPVAARRNCRRPPIRCTCRCR